MQLGKGGHGDREVSGFAHQLDQLAGVREVSGGGTAVGRRITGQRQDVVDLINSAMDGNAPAMDSLSKEMQDYVKTANVILGKSLYSDSWLEI